MSEKSKEKRGLFGWFGSKKANDKPQSEAESEATEHASDPQVESIETVDPGE
ncbi:MAG: hypothetical protein OQJ89_01245 [Kangiellaceae bacterium]|nr:hypothetical protein [Kangiellaceae bacterium]